jgi:epsin
MTFSNPISGNPVYSQFTGVPNPYQQQTVANPYQQQPQQYTGMMQQPMMTGMQFQTPQMTSMQYQQAQPTGMQFPTSSSMSNIQAGQNNPFGQTNGNNSQQSNFGSSPSMQTSTFGQSLQPQQTGFQASPMGSQSPQPSTATTSQVTYPTPTSSKSTPAASRPNDSKFSKLNALLASGGDGIDSFGNTGNLRIPVGTGFANSMQLSYNKSNNAGNNQTMGASIGDADTGSSSNVPKNFDASLLDSPAQSFGNQSSRNPFGQPTASFSSPTSNQGENKKSLFEMMQEQKLQQQISSQPTGMNFQTPQMTGFQQNQMTGFQQQQMTGFQHSPYNNGQQQQSGQFF